MAAAKNEVWLGALANAIVPNFNLSPGEKGLMVAVPLLGGALLRFPLGVLTDRIGGWRTSRHRGLFCAVR